MEALKTADGEEIRLEPGEKIYMLRAGEKSFIGREPVSPGALLQMANQALKAFQISSLDTTPHIMKREHLDETFQVEFSRPNGAIHVTIRRTAPVGAAAPPSTASPPATPSPPILESMPAPSMEASPPAAPTLQAPAAAPSASPGAAPAPTAPPAAAPAAPTKPPGASVEQPTGREAMDELLRMMVSAGASDLHLSAGILSGFTPARRGPVSAGPWRSRFGQSQESRIQHLGRRRSRNIATRIVPMRSPACHASA